MSVKDAMLDAIPATLRSRILCERRTIPALSDVASWRNYDRLWTSDDVLPIRLKALGGKPIWARGGTTDRRTIAGTFGHRYHLPPGDFAPSWIWDLGANIGTTAADLAARFPRAHVIAIELDGENAELCARNIDPWRDRCTVIHAGVWPDDGTVHYDAHGATEEGFSVSIGDTEVRALSLNTLLADHPAEGIFVKMDIEGAERGVLQTNTEWASAVSSLNVEIHPPYTFAECVSDVERLGFTVLTHPRHPFGVLATR